jgi:hypothetical protein
MKASTRNLIIVAAGVVILGGVAAALMLTGGGKDSDASSASSTESIELVSKTSNDIVSMSVKNKKGSYTLIPVASKGVTSSTASSEAASETETETVYTIEGLDGVSVDKTLASQVVQNGYSLVASKNLGAMTDLKEFGLTDPQAEVKVKFKDGSSYNYKIGSICPTDNSSYYMCGENSNNVYIVSIDSGLLESVNYFISKDILDITNSDGENDFTEIRLSGKNFPQPITIQKVDSVSSITSPVSADTDVTNYGNLEKALTSLTAKSVEAVNPDAAALSKYGLDAPTAVVEFKVNKASYKLMLGNQNEDSYYAMLDGQNVVYLVSKNSVSAWAETNLFALRNKFLVMPLIDTVKSISVTQGTTTETVAITRTKDESKSTEDKPVYTYKASGADGKELDYDKNFRAFFQKAIALELLEPAEGEPTGEPIYTIQYTYFDKTAADTIRFYKTGDRRYIATVNDKLFGIVVSTDVDTVIKDFKLLYTGAEAA